MANPSSLSRVKTTLTADDVIELGYLSPKLLEAGPFAGKWAALMPMMFTTGLMVGLDQFGYATRFCYESPAEALIALAAWDGEGFPPGWWIKQKPEDLHNPKGNRNGSKTSLGT